MDPLHDLLQPQPVRKTIGGVTFDDPFAHLQDDSPEALDWQWQEADAARDALRALPHFAELSGECAEEFQSVLPNLPVQQAGRWFGTRMAASGFGHELTHSPSPWDGAEVYCTPQALGGSADTPAYVYRATPSPDGRHAVVTVLPGGALNSRTMVVRVADGHVYPLVLEVLLFLGFGEPCWLPDSSGFVIGDRAPDRRHRVRRVTLAAEGPALHDHLFSFDEVSPDFPVLTHHVSPGGTRCIGISAPHERTAVVLGDLSANAWRPFRSPGFHGECHGDWLDDEHFAAITTDRAARGELVRIPVARSTDRSAWVSLVPEGENVLRTLIVRNARLVLVDLVDVSVRLRVLGLDGQALWTAPLPPFGASYLTFPPRIAARSQTLLLAHTTFTAMHTVYGLDTAGLRLDVSAPSRRSLDGVNVKQHFAVSRDGTRVPYFVVHRDDLPAGPTPTMMRAYGGFNLAFTPNYLSEVAPFVRCGGVYVHACLRGGGEYGSRWHDEGRLLNKQNSFDDAYAVAEDLIRRGITAPERLLLQGASNGGLLAGVAAVQRPDLFTATIAQAPLLDMMEPVQAGAGEDAERVRAVFREDYGDPQDPRHAPTLLAYSPYHNIVPGKPYPAVLQIMGEFDLGCPPFHGRRFTARLRQASTSGKPILFRTWRRGGHGSSSDPSEFANTNAEMMAFVFQQTGLAYVPR